MADISFLDTLGTKKNSEAISLNNVEAVLLDFAYEFVKDAQNNLIKTSSIASGKLSDSIHPLDIVFAGNTYTLKISIADYYDFINKGVSGTERKFNSPYSFKNIHPSKAMVDAIQQWLQQGKIKTSARDIKKYGTYGKLEAKNRSLPPANQRSIAYAVSTSIKKHGIKPTLFFDNAFTTTYPKLKKDLGIALKKDFSVMVRQINTE